MLYCMAAHNFLQCAPATSLFIPSRHHQLKYFGYYLCSNITPNSLPLRLPSVPAPTVLRLFNGFLSERGRRGYGVRSQ